MDNFEERRYKMTNEEINEQFKAITKPAKAKAEPKREPAKFPELRYLWGVALVGSFVCIVVAAIITTFLEAV